MTQWMLAIWSLVPLPFLKPAWTSASSSFWVVLYRTWCSPLSLVRSCEKGGRQAQYQLCPQPGLLGCRSSWRLWRIQEWPWACPAWGPALLSPLVSLSLSSLLLASSYTLSVQLLTPDMACWPGSWCGNKRKSWPVWLACSHGGAVVPK